MLSFQYVLENIWIDYTPTTTNITTRRNYNYTVDCSMALNKRNTYREKEKERSKSKYLQLRIAERRESIDR